MGIESEKRSWVEIKKRPCPFCGLLNWKKLASPFLYSPKLRGDKRCEKYLEAFEVVVCSNCRFTAFSCILDDSELDDVN